MIKFLPECLRAIIPAILIIIAPIEADALIHTWQGDVNTAWGTAENWANGTPRSDSVLLFPQNAQRKTNSNTLLNLEFGGLSLVGGSYNLSGFACYSRGGLISTNATSNQISLPLRIGGTLYVTDPAGHLVVSGTLTLLASPFGLSREIYSGGYIELRGVVNAQEREIVNGHTNWTAGTATLVIDGPGFVEMSSITANTYGPTRVETESTLYLNKTAGNAIPSTLTIEGSSFPGGRAVIMRPAQIADTADVLIRGEGELTVQANEVIDRLDGDGNVDLEGATLQVGVGNGSFAFTGRIIGTGGLTKSGYGTMTLDGTHNYSGDTLLTGGSMFVNGNISSSEFHLVAGTVGGNGRMGPVTVTNGILAPGLGGLSARLRMAQLSMGAAGRLSWRQDANGLSGLIVDNLVTLNNPQLEIIAHSYFSPSNGQVITLIDNRGAQLVKGQFANVPTNRLILTITDSAPVPRTWLLRYNGGDGNDVTLTFINPSMNLVPTQPLQISGGNGNAALDANECVHLRCLVSGATNSTITNVVADLQCDAEGVFILQPHTAYGNLAPGFSAANRPAFQISTSSSLPCGTNIPFRLVLRSSSHGAVTIPFSLQTGCTPGTGPCNACFATVSAVLPSNAPHLTSFFIPSGDGDACGSTNACPSVIAFPGLTRRYAVHSFTNTFGFNPLSDCYTLYLTGFGPERLVAAVYRNSFSPIAACTTNFVVCTPGFAARSTQQCRFRWQAGQVIRVVVNEFDGASNAVPYQLRIAGMVCRPELEIERLSGDRHRISWPTTAGGFELESVPALPGITESLGLPGHVWNGRFAKTNSSTAASQLFYRLALPEP